MDGGVVDAVAVVLGLSEEVGAPFAEHVGRHGGHDRDVPRLEAGPPHDGIFHRDEALLRLVRFVEAHEVNGLGVRLEFAMDVFHRTLSGSVGPAEVAPLHRVVGVVVVDVGEVGEEWSPPHVAPAGDAEAVVGVAVVGDVGVEGVGAECCGEAFLGVVTAEVGVPQLCHIGAGSADDQRGAGAITAAGRLDDEARVGVGQEEIPGVRGVGVNHPPVLMRKGGVLLGQHLGVVGRGDHPGRVAGQGEA